MPGGSSRGRREVAVLWPRREDGAGVGTFGHAEQELVCTGWKRDGFTRGKGSMQPCAAQ